MDLRCPKCNSNNLKKVSLAYQEGTLPTVDSADPECEVCLFAGGGPAILVGRATTRGTQQSALSKRLSPPAKWSYLKLIGWSGVVILVGLARILRPTCHGESRTCIFVAC